MGHLSDSVREDMCRLLLVVTWCTSNKISLLISMPEDMGTAICTAKSETGVTGMWLVRKSTMSVFTGVMTWGDDLHAKDLVDTG